MNAQPVPDWLEEQTDGILVEAVAVARTELWVRYVVDWAYLGGRTVPWDALRREATEGGIEPRHLDAALQNLNAGTRRVGDHDVVHLPKETA